jgi:hypothetical protein
MDSVFVTFSGRRSFHVFSMGHPSSGNRILGHFGCTMAPNQIIASWPTPRYDYVVDGQVASISAHVFVWSCQIDERVSNMVGSHSSELPF